MRVLVIGAEGQLAHDVRAVYADCELRCADLDGDDYQLDMKNGEAVNALIAEEVKPDIVINTAAAHNLPQCEATPEIAWAVNATAVRDLADACAQVKATLVHIGTDYVFGNGGTRPYLETDPPAPLSVYAASKLAGEHLIRAHCADHRIVRTAAIYGAAPCRAKGGRNFVQLMLHLAANRPEVKVVTDEWTTPTWTKPLAQQIRVLIEKGAPGTYHATCQGECTWHAFAQAIFEETKTEVNLREATGADFPSPVKRPNYSVLENAQAQAQGIDTMPPWREALRGYLAEAELTAA